ncbi:tetratricopeptide repeat domain protein [Verrucomicrobiia bacterium DG1235]|nr:tetratricopeptide repeat domain protein [Verrucomicrobiae bacterium DG1235]
MSASLASSQEIEYRTLPELIESGSSSLVRGDFPQAAHAFNSILENYREEPVWLEGQLPAKILPLAGFASHKSGLHSAAILALETYLEHHATEANSEIFARYTLASSLLLDGQETAARTAFADLRQIAGHSPFRDLSLIREALLSDPQTAAKLLAHLLQNPASPRLATFARLQLIRIYLEEGDLEYARAQLLDTQWQEKRMPELATLSFLATQIADALLANHPADALKAYQLVQPKEKLIAAQQARISELNTTYKQLAPTLRTEQSMWSDHFRKSLAGLQKQLVQLSEAPSYYEAISLRKARCFSRLNRPLEAWLLLEPIANSSSPQARIAHLDWISVARQMQAWNASALIAQKFIDMYPDDKDAAQALFWIALSQIDQNSYQPAIVSLKKLLETNPTRQLEAASHYYLGYCHFMLGQHQIAIASFQQATHSAPDLPIAAQAQLWIGICQFTTNQLEAAIETFAQIKNSPAHSFLRPEAAYREIAAHYALGNLDEALPAIENWLSAYPAHPREAEARLLQGDLLQELGKLEAAIAAYAAIETADPEFAYFALEKRCALLLETDQSDTALADLKTYPNQHALPLPYAGSYTQILATSLENNKLHTEAQNAIELAIQTYGNLPKAGGILELIQQTTNQQASYENALANQQPTLASRYLVAQINTLQTQNQSSQAELKALQLATHFDRKHLPPEALLHAGNALADIQSHQTTDYFEAILISYPNSHYIDSARLGLARHHANLDQPELALAHLEQISLATPDSLSLQADLEYKQENYNAAQNSCEPLLADRQSTPAQKANSLLILGQIAQAQNRPTQAYAYYQRIFTLYRGEIEQVGHAYLACAQILSSQSRYNDAQSVAQEFLAQPNLLTHPARKKAETLLTQLAPHTQAPTSP